MKAVARTVASTNIGSMPKIRFARSLAPSQRGCVERTTILEPVPIGYCLTRCHRNVVGVATCHDEQRSDSRTAKDHCGKERIVRMPCTPCDKARPESSATEKQRAYSEEFHQRAQLHNSTQNVDCGERQRDIERRQLRGGGGDAARVVSGWAMGVTPCLSGAQPTSSLSLTLPRGARAAAAATEPLYTAEVAITSPPALEHEASATPFATRRVHAD